MDLFPTIFSIGSIHRLILLVDLPTSYLSSFFGGKKPQRVPHRVVCVCHLAAQGSMTSFANSQLGQICPRSTKPASRWIIELQFETYTTKVVRRHLICSNKRPLWRVLDSNLMEQLPRPPRTLHGKSVLALSRLANSCWRFPRKVEEISIYYRYFCVNCIKICDFQNVQRFYDFQLIYHKILLPIYPEASRLLEMHGRASKIWGQHSGVTVWILRWWNFFVSSNSPVSDLATLQRGAHVTPNKACSTSPLTDLAVGTVDLLP